jgi:diadenylate cyclase
VTPLSQALVSTFSRFANNFPWSAIDILLVALIIYGLLSLFKGTSAFSLLYGIILLFIGIAVISSIPGLVMLNWLLRNSLQFLSVALIIIFQPELRRAMERIGRLRPMFSYPLGPQVAHGTARAIEDIAVTCRRLSERRWGALIVLERRTGLQEFSDTGVRVDGTVSVEFLLTVFFPNSPLHDGAVVVHGDRVVAAGCLLPLSESDTHYQELGTRHRAALGITEITDAIAIVVSEETGIISIANNGRLVRNLDENKVKKVLTLLYGSQRNENPFLNMWLRRRPATNAPDGQAGGSSQGNAESGA